MSRRRHKTNRARVNEAIEDIRRSYRNTVFFKSFGMFNEQHVTIPKELQPFIEHEFRYWWESWIAPKLQEIEAVNNPLSAEESDLIAGKAGA